MLPEEKKGQLGAGEKPRESSEALLIRLRSPLCWVRTGRHRSTGLHSPQHPWWDGSQVAETGVPSGPETQSEAGRASDSSGTRQEAVNYVC